MDEEGHAPGDEAICRVCLCPAEEGEEDGGPLLRPCQCKGSMEYVHEECLVQWLAVAGHSHCAFCSHEFSFVPLYAANAPAVLLPTDVCVALSERVAVWVPRILRVALALVLWIVVVPLLTYWMFRVALYRGCTHWIAAPPAAAAWMDAMHLDTAQRSLNFTQIGGRWIDAALASTTNSSAFPSELHFAEALQRAPCAAATGQCSDRDLVASIARAARAAPRVAQPLRAAAAAALAAARAQGVAAHASRGVRATLRERLVEAHLLPALERVRWDVLHADWLAGIAMCLAIVVVSLALISVTDFYQLFADDQVELEHAAMDAREAAWNGAIAALEAWADAADAIDVAIERAMAVRERERELEARERERVLERELEAAALGGTALGAALAASTAGDVARGPLERLERPSAAAAEAAVAEVGVTDTVAGGEAARAPRPAPRLAPNVAGVGGACPDEDDALLREDEGGAAPAVAAARAAPAARQAVLPPIVEQPREDLLAGADDPPRAVAAAHDEEAPAPAHALPEENDDENIAMQQQRQQVS